MHTFYITPQTVHTRLSPQVTTQTNRTLLTQPIVLINNQT